MSSGDPAAESILGLCDQIDRLETQSLEILSRLVIKELDRRRALSMPQSGHVSELRRIRNLLETQEVVLTGSEAALLAAMYLFLQGVEMFLAKQVSNELESYGRKLANLSATLDALKEKGCLVVTEGAELNRHKTYQLSETGRASARMVISRVPAN